MNAPSLFSEGRPIRLGRRIGKGGEGEVYAIDGQADQALKLYTIPDVLSRKSKIVAMIEAGLARQSSLVSYPSAVVTDARGLFAGFLMRLVKDHQPIHHLYAPGDRKAHFPEADYRFLIRSALNVARALADVHARDCVVGDINHSGILVSDRAIVALIDADSFQVTDGTTRYLCKVGVPEYTPPELQGQSLTGISRTPDHDAFGLAVLVFQLLCMGRHPFVGSYSRGEMPIQRAITEHRFAYSLRRDVGMKPPPGATLLSDFPAPIAQAFEAAFGRDIGRPTAAQWVGVLEQFEAQLKRCSANALHYYATAAPECPWCRMERTVGVVLFLPPNAASDPRSFAGAFDLRAVWAAIEAVALPPATTPQPLLPPIDVTPSVGAVKAARQIFSQRLWAMLFVAVAAGGAIVAPLVWFIWLILGTVGLVRLFGPAAPGKPFRRRALLAEERWVASLAGWQRRCGASEVLADKQSLADARRQLENLPNEHRKRIANYEAHRRDFQLRSHLEKHRLADVRIDGIGPGLKATLASWGIDSALGVNRAAIMRIDGFGQSKVKAMVAWRRQIETRFVFDPRSSAVDAHEKDRINREIALRGHQLRTKLSRGADDLRTATRQVHARWKAIDPALAKTFRERSQAFADDRHVNARLGMQWKRSSVTILIAAIVAAAVAGLIFGYVPLVTRSTGDSQATPGAPVMEKLDPIKLFVVAPGDPAATADARDTPGGDRIVELLPAGKQVIGIGRAAAPDGSSWIAYLQTDGSIAWVPERLLKDAAAVALADSCTGKTGLVGTLCRDPVLRRLDGQLNRKYADLERSLSDHDRARLADDQRQWLAERDDCTTLPDPGSCLTAAYRARLTELDGFATSSPTPPESTVAPANAPSQTMPADTDDTPQATMPPIFGNRVGTSTTDWSVLTRRHRQGQPPNR